MPHKPPPCAEMDKTNVVKVDNSAQLFDNLGLNYIVKFFVRPTLNHTQYQGLTSLVLVRIDQALNTILWISSFDILPNGVDNRTTLIS